MVSFIKRQSAVVTSKFRSDPKRAVIVVATVLCLVVAGHFIFKSHAAGPVVSTEPETGTVTEPTAACPDAGASAGAGVRFSYTGCSTAWPKYTTPLMAHEPGGNPIWHNGWYYMPVKCGGETVIRMVRARWLKDFTPMIKDCASIRAQRVVWDGSTLPSTKVYVNWPILFTRLNNKWYIYMDASGSTTPFTDRLQVIEANTDDPFGPWTLKSSRIGQDTWAIGYSPFVWNNQMYMIVSNREGHTAGTHHALAIATMSNPWTASSNWITLTDPTFAWEKNSADGPNTAPINEVDQPLIHNGKLHIMFSASHVNSTLYTAGVLTYRGTGSLLDRNSWIKRTTPIWSNTATTVGAGQTFTFKSPDGTKDYVGYAYWRTPTLQSPRPLGFVPITWNANNDPVFPPLPNPGTQFDEPPKPVTAN